MLTTIDFSRRGSAAFYGSSPWAGLGAYEAGVCADGADMICDVKGGLFSCRPCTFDQLATFKNLQEQLNALISALGISVTPLVIDGRIGAKTTKAAALVYQTAGQYMSLGATERAALEAALSNSSSPDSMRMVAESAPELMYKLQDLINNAGRISPGAPPVAAEQPELPGIPVGPTAPPTLPGTIPMPPAPPKTSGVKVAIGILAGLATVGLVGAGVHYARKGSRRG